MEQFEAVISSEPRGGPYIKIPPDVVAALGGGGRIPVNVTFDGIPYRGSIVTMGGQKIVGILKAIQSELGKSAGDTITVTVDVDGAERKVDIPDDLGAALAEAGA